MWRHIAANAMTVLIVALVVAVGVVALYKQRFVEPGPLQQAICLVVEPGSSMAKVSQDLKAQGAVTDARLFRVGAQYIGKAGALKAGSFLVTEGASMAQIVEEITGTGVSTCGTEVVYRIGVTQAEMRVRELDPATNKFVDVAEFDPKGEVPPQYGEVRAKRDTRYRIAVAEGTTVWQVLDALTAADFLAGEVTAPPPEGMLAADSYEVTPGADRAELVAKMQAEQQARLNAAWEERDPDVPVATPEELLTLASLVEKETGVPEERRRVASVFENRLKQGVRLQTDPAVIYGITLGKGALGRGLRQSELRRETPYNTYVIDGLPPGPIANPGEASLQAAAHPESTDFLYFVADGSGGHAFARTLAEHNDNVAKWRKIEAEQGSGSGSGN